MANLDTTIKVKADSSGVAAGLEAGKRSLKDFGGAAAQAGDAGAKTFARIGEGGDAASKKVEQATKNTISSIQRQIAAFEAGGTSSRQYQESLAKLRGIDTAALKPYLDQLDSAKIKAAAAAKENEALSGSFATMKTAILGAVAAAGAFGLFVKKINDGVDALNDLKDATGASIENISGLEDIAKRTGTGFDTVGTSLIKLNQALNSAKPNSSAELAIKAIGLSVSDLKALDPAEAFRKTAVALSGFSDDANKARLTQELFGKSLKEIAPLLKDVAENGELSATVFTKQAEEAEKFNKNIFALEKNVLDLSRSLFSKLIPALNQVFADFRTFGDKASLASAASDVLRLNKELTGLEGIKVGKFNLFGGVTAQIKQVTAELNVAKRTFNELDKNRKPADDSYNQNETNRLLRNRPSVGDLPDAPAIAAKAAAAKAAAAAANKELAEQAKLLAELSGLTGSFAADWDRLSTIYQSGKLSLDGLTKAQADLLAKQPAIKAAADEQAKALEVVTKANLAAADAHAKYVTSLADGLDKMHAETLAQQESNDRLGLSKEAISALDAVKLESQAITLELLAIKTLDKNLDEAQYNLYKAQAEELRKLATLKSQGAYKEAQIEAAKAARDEWEKTAEKINDSLTDALMRGFESGKDFAKNMRDTVVNMFKTMILRPVISAVMNPVSQAIGGSLGMAGAAQAGQGGLLSGLSTASSLATLGSAIGTGLAGTVGTAVSSIFGATAGNTAIGMTLGYGSSASLAAASAASVAGGGAAAGAGLTGASSMLGAIPVVGWAALAAVAVASIFGGRGDVESKGKGIEGNFGGSGFAGNTYANYSQDGGWFHSDRNWTDKGAIDANTGNALSAGFGSLKASATGAALALGLSTTAIANYSEAVKVQLTDDATKNNEIITKMMADLGDHMAGAAAPGLAAFAKVGETSSTTLQRLSGSITTANAWLHLLQNRLFNVSMAGADAASKLVDAFGGLDQLAASSKSYYEAYYSEAERTTASSRDLAKALALVNVKLPASKDAFRDVVTSLDLTTESGRNAYAVLLALAPEYAATSDAIARMAKESATKLMQAFTGNGLLLPALDATQLAIGDFTGATTVMGGKLSFINSIMGDSTSAVIGFSNGAYIMGTSLSASQLSAGLLNDQIVALQGNADKARIDFAGLAEALATVNTETFVATLALVFENLATRISGVIGDIGTERIAVREAALQIINPTVMGKAQIQSGIAGINVSLPSNAGVVSANARLNYAEQNQAWQKSYSASTVAAYQGALDSAKKTAADLPATYKAKYAEWVALQQKYGNVFANEKWNEGQTRTAFQYNESTNRLKGYGANYSTWGSWGWSDVNGFNNDPKRAALQGDLQNANYNLEQSEKNVVSWAQSLASVTQQQAALATSAASATAAAQAAAKKAVLDYAAAMQNFVIDASKSVGKLSKLREETVKYYEAQKALADLMSTSAAGLRSTVETYRYNQKTPEQQLADLQGKYSTAYSTAMAVQGNGEALAGQGDKLNALLQPLIEKLNETGNSNLVNSYLAQAETVAKMIEAAIPVNYQADSLSMLGSIDATLAALDASSQSAEKIIADAIKAGSDKTAAGLHAVIAALSGQAIPAFATGGSYAGGLALVGERGPEVINFDQPGQVYNAAQTRGMFAGGNNMARLEALVERQGKQLEAMSYELRAIAGSTNKTARSLDQALGEGDGALAVKVIA